METGSKLTGHLPGATASRSTRDRVVSLPARITSTSDDLQGLWRQRCAVPPNGVDHVELILLHGDWAASGVCRAADWVARWSAAYRGPALTLLGRIRSEATARDTLATASPGGDLTFWDVVLQRLPGHDAVISYARNCTAEHQQKEALRRVAYHDSLTGLLNRAALRECLERRLDESSRRGGTLAAMMVDVDNFKPINDVFGHDAGDAVLVEIAQRLRFVVPEDADTGRLGGDEFLVIFDSMPSGIDVQRQAEIVLDALRAPLVYKSRILDTRGSIGLAMSPAHGVSASELLKHADLALYAAKSGGRDRTAIYTPAMSNALRRRGQAVETVLEAIKQNRVEAYYQPKVTLEDGTIRGFEALLRLRGANGALVPAFAIRHAFDDYDIARAIGDRMFERVAHDMRSWRAAGMPPVRVALNASQVEFQGGDFASRLIGRIRDAGLAPELFEIEIAESLLSSRSLSDICAPLRELADAGVNVALDEFGAGSASISQIRTLPLNSIKIDRSCVNNLSDDESAHRAVVRAVIGVAHGFGLQITGMGIETAAQLEALQELGCETGQGDLLGAPVSGFELTRQFDHRNASPVTV
jgi:diguanylate cyclase (GGDEF)-like protein